MLQHWRSTGAAHGVGLVLSALLHVVEDEQDEDGAAE